MCARRFLGRRYRLEQFRRVAEPLVRVLGGHPLDQAGRGNRKVGAQPANRRQRLAEHRRRNRHRVAARERQPAREHLEEGHPQREDVRAAVNVRFRANLFGRGVGWGAEEPPRVGVYLLPDRLGQAEVGHPHAAIACQEDVVGLDVAVDDSASCGVVESLCHLGRDPQRLLLR